MFHDNDSQLVVNLDYQLTKKIAFMITKTLFIRWYSIKCDISSETLQHNIMHCIIALTHNSLSQSNIKRTTKNLVHSSYNWNDKLFLIMKM